jgi:hypothetical protein
MPSAERPTTHPQPPPRRRADPLRWLISGRNPAEAVYGTVTAGALLAAESGLRETYPETVGSLAIAIVLYWFAHAYADVLGLRLSKAGRLTWDELWRTFIQDWAIVRGAAAPVLAVVVAWIVGAEQSTAVTAGVWAAVASLIAFELAAGLRSKASTPEMVLQVTAGVTLGIGILVLRALLH